MNKTAIAKDLIESVQECDLSKLNKAIDRAYRYSRREYHLQPQEKRGAMENLLNYTIAPLGITALHVAIGMYANDTGPKSKLNSIIQVLLEHGSNPYIPFGQKFKQTSFGPVISDPGLTVFMLFKGDQLAPSLRSWMEIQREDEVVHSLIEPMKNRELIAA